MERHETHNERVFMTQQLVIQRYIFNSFAACAFHWAILVLTLSTGDTHARTMVSFTPRILTPFQTADHPGPKD